MELSSTTTVLFTAAATASVHYPPWYLLTSDGTQAGGCQREEPSEMVPQVNNVCSSRTAAGCDQHSTDSGGEHGD